MVRQYVCELQRACRGCGRGCNCARVIPLHQRLVYRADVVVVVAHGPYITARYRIYSIEEIVGCAHVGAWDHAPGTPIPVLYKCLIRRTVVVITDNPYITA